MYVCNPVPLYQIRHAELLGEENIKLTALIEEDAYAQQIKRTQELNTRLRVHGLPEENFTGPKRVTGLFLSLSKRGEEFVLQVEYIPSVSEKVFEQRVSKEPGISSIVFVTITSLSPIKHSLPNTKKNTNQSPHLDLWRLQPTGSDRLPGFLTFLCTETSTANTKIYYLPRDNIFTMQELPDEIALSILQEVPVEDLPAFCASNRQYRGLCSDRYLWYSIFEKEGLTLLEEGTDLPSWLAVYRGSVLSREKADYILSLYQKERRGWIDVFKRIPLYKIRDASLLGEEEDPELSELVSIDLYSKQLRDAQGLQDTSFTEPIPYNQFSYTEGVEVSEETFLVITKRGKEFVLSVEDKENHADLERTISEEQTRNILYRLAYYGLLKLDPSIFAVYKREQQGGRPQRPRRLPLLTSDS